MEYSDYIYPDVTTILITYNNSQNILFTLEKVLGQAYPSHEVIIIDAGSTDRTLEILNPFLDSLVRLVSVAKFDPYEMMNKGISLAKGEYLNFLAPGDFYLSETSTRKMMDIALAEKKPYLLYGNSLLRFAGEEPKLLYRPLSLELLRQGRQPATLQAMWFHREFFHLVGKFDHRYKFRAEYDLLCKFMQQSMNQFAATSHVVIDFDFRALRGDSVWLHFKDTVAILYRHFGTQAVFRWFWRQKDLDRTLSMVWKAVRISVLGK